MIIFLKIKIWLIKIYIHKYTYAKAFLKNWLQNKNKTKNTLYIYIFFLKHKRIENIPYYSIYLI